MSFQRVFNAVIDYFDLLFSYLSSTKILEDYTDLKINNPTLKILVKSDQKQSFCSNLTLKSFSVVTAVHFKNVFTNS